MSTAMDDARVFKALADESRRALLDEVLQEDGRTLTALEERLPQMTRFGVMKHLRVLEEAGLVLTEKQGRQKLHFLNPAPISDVFDRWVGKYSQPHLRVLAGIRSSLENKTMTKTKTHTHVIQTYIRATAEEVWKALTDPDMTQQFFFDTKLSSDLRPGSPFQYIDPKGEVMIDGKVVECDPPRKLVSTFVQMWEGATVDGGTVTYELTQLGEMTKVRLTHEGLPEGHPLVEATFGGWSYILAGLKTLVETGSRLEASGA